MRLILRDFGRSFLVAGFGAVLLCSGCAVHAGYYDPYYHDYHDRHGEVVYYNQWEHDTHREHRDLNKRNDADKREYWDWRHKQDVHDHH